MIDAVIEELKTHQTQLDMDGVMVGVSRQALEELLAHVAAPAHPAPIAGLEPVAWQSRQKFNLERAAMGNIGGWSECSSDEATDHWACRPEREYRGLVPVAQAEAHAAEQVRAEREACAAIADVQYDEAPSSNSYDNGGSTIGWMEASRTIAAAVRARK